MKEFLAALMLCFTAGCGENTSRPEVSIQDTKDTLLCAVDTSGFQMLDYERWFSLVDVVEDTLHPLSLHDLQKVECLLMEEVRDWNSDTAQHYRSDDRIELSAYARQYCALTNEQGHRLVLLNMFCGDPGANKGWVIVMDGGHCYFQALFDLSIGSVLRFSVNGEA